MSARVQVEAIPADPAPIQPLWVVEPHYEPCHEGDPIVMFRWCALFVLIELAVAVWLLA